MASATTNNSSSSPSSSMTENRGSPTQSRRPSRQVSSPWTQIVRGESEPTIAAASSSPQSMAPIEPIASASVAPPASSPLTVEAAAGDEKSEVSGAQGNAGKKPVWKRPSNGASEVGPVMGASSWPALSETAKAPSNKSSSDSLISLGDVASSSSVPVSQIDEMSWCVGANNLGHLLVCPRQERFVLNGVDYTLPINKPPNSLHGGNKGFNKKIWDVAGHKKDGDKPSIIFKYHSSDGEEGYPGAVAVTATYMLTSATTMRLDMEAVPENKDTPISLAQHTYWNLALSANDTGLP